MTTTISKSRLWAARIMSGIVILFMLMASIMKLIQPEQVVQEMPNLGYAEHHISIIGMLGLISVLCYAYPRTSVLGAILLTGYWGGAIANHLRLDDPFFSHIMGPVYLAVLAWGGLWLRKGQVRDVIPLTQQTEQKKDNVSRVNIT